MSIPRAGHMHWVAQWWRQSLYLCVQPPSCCQGAIVLKIRAGTLFHHRSITYAQLAPLPPMLHTFINEHRAPPAIVFAFISANNERGSVEERSRRVSGLNINNDITRVYVCVCVWRWWWPHHPVVGFVCALE